MTATTARVGCVPPCPAAPAPNPYRVGTHERAQHAAQAAATTDRVGAVVTVAGHATDPDDARRLLAALDLLLAVPDALHRLRAHPAPTPAPAPAPIPAAAAAAERTAAVAATGRPRSAPATRLRTSLSGGPRVRHGGQPPAAQPCHPGCGHKGISHPRGGPCNRAGCPCPAYGTPAAGTPARGAPAALRAAS